MCSNTFTTQAKANYCISTKQLNCSISVHTNYCQYILHIIINL